MRLWPARRFVTTTVLKDSWKSRNKNHNGQDCEPED